MTRRIVSLFLVITGFFMWVSRRQWVPSKSRIAGLFMRVARTRWVPSEFRWQAMWAALMLQPVAGGVGQNGAIVVLKIDILGTGGEDFQLIGGQGSLSISESTDEIDVSDKLSGRLGERVAGRASASVSVDLNFRRDDVAQSYLKTKYRDRELVEVMVFDRDDADVITGTNIEKASGLIVTLDEEHPDQDVSTMSLEINLNNDWVAA